MTGRGVARDRFGRVERARLDAGVGARASACAASAGSRAASPTRSTVVALARVAEARRRLDAVATVVAGAGETTMRRHAVPRRGPGVPPPRRRAP